MMNYSIDAPYKISQDSKLSGFDLEIDRLYENFFNVLSEPCYDSPHRQLQDLLDTKEKSEKELDEARIALAGSQQKVDKLTEEYESLKKLVEELKNHDYVIAQKKAALENELSVLQNSKINPHDEELVEKTKFQYKCQRDLTQVRFKFDKSNEDVLEGYVFNKVTNNVKSFTFNTSELDCDQIREGLLKLMKDTSHPSYADVPLG